MPGHGSVRKSEFWKEREVRKEAGKGDKQRPVGDAFFERFDEAFSGAREDEPVVEHGPLGTFARERVRGSDGISGPRYIVDPGSLLDAIDEMEGGGRDE